MRRMLSDVIIEGGDMLYIVLEEKNRDVEPRPIGGSRSVPVRTVYYELRKYTNIRRAGRVFRTAFRASGGAL